MMRLRRRSLSRMSSRTDPPLPKQPSQPPKRRRPSAVPVPPRAPPVPRSGECTFATQSVDVKGTVLQTPAPPAGKPPSKKAKKEPEVKPPPKSPVKEMTDDGSFLACL